MIIGIHILELSVKSHGQGVRTASLDIIGHQMHNGNENFTKRNNLDSN